MKNLGKISKKGTENIVVWTLFNKKQIKFKKRSQKCTRKHKNTRTELEHRLRELVSNHNKPGLVHELKTLVLSLLQRKLGILVDIANTTYITTIMRITDITTITGITDITMITDITNFHTSITDY